MESFRLPAALSAHTVGRFARQIRCGTSMGQSYKAKGSVKVMLMLCITSTISNHHVGCHAVLPVQSSQLRHRVVRTGLAAKYHQNDIASNNEAL